MKRKIIPIFFFLSVLIFCGCSSVNSVSSNEVSERINTYQSLQLPVSLGSLSLSEEGLSGSIVRMGNPDRFLSFLNRCESGNDLTIAFIGGSITEGCNASPMNTSSYASLTYQWFVQSFPNSNFTYVNAGIGGTDSYLGIHRLEEQVLDYHPDLIITEFAVNDGNTYNKESYESLLRKCLTEENAPAVLPLILTTEGGWDHSDEEQLLAFYYDLPIVSYKEALNKGNISWSSVGDSDGVHPINAGHALIAHLLTNYFYTLATSEDLEYVSYSIPESPSTKCRYLSSTLVYGDTLQDYSDNFKISESSNFIGESILDFHFPHTGWGTSSDGSLTIEVTGTALGICYQKIASEPAGSYIVSVDGTEITTLHTDWDTSSWNKIETFEIFKETSSGSHTVTITPAEENTGSLHIIGFLFTP